VGILGAHVSIAGGIQKAPGRGTEINAAAIQVFTANQNQWFPRQPSVSEISEFKSNMVKERPEICVSHDSYLVNLGSPDEKKLNRSRQAFLAEIDRCEACEIPYLIFHPGAHLGEGETACLRLIAESIDFCLHRRPESRVVFLLETTAGQGTNVGYKFEHLAEIIEYSGQPDRLGVCIDTQHIFAAGYDVRTKTGWEDTLDRFDNIVGLERIKTFHLNDSKKELGTRVDRHENIGKGHLTLETFWYLVNEKRFDNIPMILETPVKQEYGYAEELALLRSLIGSKTPE